ncbi:GSU2403 family nucleotidyltransferase fold protein [Nocardioides halotolerans]|uniref:GSU2403 family nucleotidyltransferase fold protein n=1 Tax=Nocardioides halotolerans TaxID=433660 RepID=UPI00048D2975|nr:GSU2403 family nucleotidyltransferase fold protein [Nocardioides halotolerans]
MPGADNLIVEARTALLDAIAALEAHKASVILIGAQAIYLRTGNATFALAEATKDSDLAIDTRELGEDPLLEEAMTSAGFILNPVSQQPGAWISPNGIPVDLMVPEHLWLRQPTRRPRIPPHSKHAARRAAGLEAALIDQSPMTIDSLNGDGRSAVINVAGSAALLVAKLHKLGERVDTPDRLNDKDAHDIYRLLVATETHDLAKSMQRLHADEVSHGATTRALGYLEQLFANADALGATMAGRAEEGVGQPDTVSASVSLLAQDLLSALA